MRIHAPPAALAVWAWYPRFLEDEDWPREAESQEVMQELTAVARQLRRRLCRGIPEAFVYPEYVSDASPPSGWAITWNDAQGSGRIVMAANADGSVAVAASQNDRPQRTFPSAEEALRYLVKVYGDRVRALEPVAWVREQPADIQSRIEVTWIPFPAAD